MTNETVLTNGRLILHDETIKGTIVFRDGKIADISTGNVKFGEDLEGDTIIPGLVELHTDHLESHFLPRPKVKWNANAAIMAHDAQIAGSGITTVLDALRIGADENSDLGMCEMRLLADVIKENSQNGHLRAEHLLHLRCEVSAPDCLQGFEVFRDDDVKLVSLMDHAPGQRQFVNLEAYRIYYIGKKKMSEKEFEAFSQRRREESLQNSQNNRETLAQLCQNKGIILASHDDATIEHVNEALTQKISVAEFPTTFEAAKASHDGGLSVLMGAPNLMRGGSHSGNIAAKDLAERGQLDILSSDYIPYSLVSAAFKLPKLIEGFSLWDAINMVSRNPANAIGLNDRGILEEGKKADCVRVFEKSDVPVIRTVWREGKRVS